MAPCITWTWARRLLTNDTTLFELFARLWEIDQYQPIRAKTNSSGIARTMRKQLRNLQWQWPQPHLIIDDEGVQWHWLKMAAAELAHIIRRAMRKSLWRNLGQRRPTYAALRQRDIDTSATRAVSHQAATTAAEVGTLHAIMADAIMTCQRLKIAGLVDDETCPGCGKATEDLDHLFYECPGTELSLIHI